MKIRIFSVYVITALGISSCHATFTNEPLKETPKTTAEEAKKLSIKQNSNNSTNTEMNSKELTEEDWRAKLSAEEFYILREKGTERPFSGKYNDFFEKGNYKCAGCGSVLFTDKDKFQSGCGWPSFDHAIPNTIEETQDFTHGMIRTEITCKNCGGHLGHVFNDGPTQTGLRYCVNSISLKFEEK